MHQDVIAFGAWRYLAGTYDGQVARSWVDSKVIVEQNVAGTVASTPSAPLLWSNDCCSGRMLDGILDEIVIVNRALDEAEMKELMDFGSKVVLSVDVKDKLATRWAEIKSQ